MTRPSVVCIVLLLYATSSAYGLTWEKVFLVSKSGESEARTGARVVKQGDRVEVFAIVQAKENGRRRYFGKPSKIRIGEHPVAVEPLPKDLHIQWSKVEPLMQHTDGKGHDPANPDFLWYTNAGAPGGRTDRQSLSPDRIRYKETEIPALQDHWSIRPDAHPSDPTYDQYKGLGTMRYAVTVLLPRGNKLQSPGSSSYQDLGISPDVFRLTVIPENSYAGHLAGYFNVPGVFGSYPQQVDRYVGVDCADLVVAGWNRYHGAKIPYTNVTGLRYSFVSEGRLKLILGDHYLMGKEIAKQWNAAMAEMIEPASLSISSAGLHVGDILVFNYNADPQDRSWDHVGVLYADSGPRGKPNGILDGEDVILHAGPAEASWTLLGSSSFSAADSPTRFAVLRWTHGSPPQR